MTEAKESLDITRELCPMTYVRTKLKLESLLAGELLEVLLLEGEALKNVPAAAREDGHEVLSVARQQDGVYRVLLRKRGSERWQP